MSNKSTDRFFAIINTQDDADELQRKIQAARKHLTELKSNQIVLARTRTVKRLLDNVRLNGSQNASGKIPREDLLVYAKELTNLKDSIEEKKRELSFSQEILSEKEKVLYDKKCQLEELKLQAEKDFDNSQKNVAEHANRNAMLSLKLQKMKKAISKMKIREIEIKEEIELKSVEIKKENSIQLTKSQNEKSVYLLEKSASEKKLSEAKSTLKTITEKPSDAFIKWKMSQEEQIKEFNKKKEAEDIFNDPLDERVKELQEKLRNASKMQINQFSPSEMATINRLERDKNSLFRKIESLNTSSSFDLAIETTNSRVKKNMLSLQHDDEDDEEIN
ncbi:unnamed protein product [Oikopleura dioica]|uniref:Uncharacterized protein n=1 Tax=Oikopleura dioica TaxID=34765 RepID=E4Y4B5_OIKDI|nr:unnamed protein product [Oikopleura dioica]